MLKECRLNTLKINELKRQLRLGAVKPPAETPSGPTKGPGGASRDTKISKDVEQIKRDMRAEKSHEGTEEKPHPEVNDAAKPGVDPNPKPGAEVAPAETVQEVKPSAEVPEV